jgi:phosphoribosylaminoimidazole-succinocarboxamide synthase
MEKKDKTKENMKSKIRYTAKDIQHYNGILIESLKSEFRLVNERMDHLEQRLICRMDETDLRNERRFRDIESILRLHTEYHRQHFESWKENDKKWDENNRRWEENNKRWDENNQRWNENSLFLRENAKSLDQKFNELHQRFDQIDQKLILISDKVEFHDHEIQALKLRESFT